MLLLRWGLLSFALLIFAGPLIQLSLEARQIEPDVWEHIRSHLLFSGLTETLLFSVGSAFVAAITGTAWAILSLFIPNRRFLFSLSMALLLALPTYVMGFLILSFIDYSGPVQKILLTFTTGEYFFEPRTRLWAIITYGVASSPYVYFAVLAGLQTQIKILIEASVSLGSNFYRCFRFILIPSLLPWIIGGATLVALEACADFGFVDLFGINSLSRILYKSWGSLFSFGGAARLSLVLMLVCSLIIFISQKFKNATFEQTLSGQQKLNHLFSVSPSVRLCLSILMFLGLLVLSVIPLGALVFHASNLQIWQELAWGRALLSSLSIALISSLFIGVLMAALFFSWRKAGPPWFFKLFSMGYGLPGTLLSVAFYIFVASYFDFNQQQNKTFFLFVMIGCLYFSKFSGLMLKGLSVQKSQISTEILEAASSLGTPAKNWRQVELPLYGPSLILGFFLLFLEVIKELPAALMIKPLEEPTLAVRIHQYASESDWARASVFSLVLVLLICLIVFIQKTFAKYLTRTQYESAGS